MKPVFLTLLLACSPAFAQDAPKSVPVESATTLAWFVEIDGDKHAVRAAAANAGIKYTERYSYDTLWNGISIDASASHAGALAKLSGVVAIYPVDTISIEQMPEFVNDSSPEMLTAIAMSGANTVQAAGFDGTGIKIGIIDSGIDFDHPDLGGCFGPGCKVEAGFDFVGDAYAAGVSAPNPDAIPDDCPGVAATIPGLPRAGGHGTHVAGIAAANGALKGTAPGATLGAYRVFGCSGSTSGDIMLAAMERAYADGMDVVNMSIGSSHQWPQYPTAVAANSLVERGVVVVTSFGNSGATGLFSGSAPGVGERVIAVGSVNNSHVRGRYFTVTPDGTAIPFNQAAAAPTAPTSGSAALVRTGSAVSLDDACNALPAGSLAGQAALVRRGGCSFRQKSLNAQAAGATAVVIYNNVAGLQIITVAGTPAIMIPVVSISQADGHKLDGRIQAGPVTLTWNGFTGLFPSDTGNLTSAFSSYGLTPDLQVKPNLTAPGGSILSTYPLGFAPYAIISGTSMASPHVAGNVAQLLQAEPGLTPDEVRVRLQNTAQPILWYGNPGLGFLENIHRQGAGHVRIDRAVGATSRVSPARIALGESVASGRHKVKLDISNAGTEAVTYAVHHEPALATGPTASDLLNDTIGPFRFGFYASLATADAASSVSVAAGGTTSVQVEVVEPAGLPAPGLYGGYIVFMPDDGSAVIRVPYAGFKGNYQALEVLQPASAFDFPWLAQAVGTNLSPRPNGATYTMDGGDIPYFLFHLAHQSRTLEMTVREVGGSQANWHSIFKVDYMRRNGGNNPATLTDSYYRIPWDGYTLNPSSRKLFQVPNGQYQVTLTARKALGNAFETESWTSPVITIARP